MIPVSRPRIADIQRATASVFGIPLDKMCSPQRSRCYAEPRQIAMYLVNSLTEHTQRSIALHFKRDRATVIHAIRKVEGMRAGDRLIMFADLRINAAIAAIIATLEVGTAA